MLPRLLHICCLIAIPSLYHFKEVEDGDALYHRGDVHHWNYANQHHWDQVYKDCFGKRQSPVDLHVKCKGKANPKGITTQYDPTMKINFHRYQYSQSGKYYQIFNSGHGAQVKYRISQTVNNLHPKVSGTAMNNHVYQFEQFHFHWHSSKDRDGSEHAMNGQRFAAELHFVHFNTKYLKLSEALLKPDGLAVLAVFIELQEKNNTNFNIVMKNLEYIIEEKAEHYYLGVKDDFRLNRMLPVDREKFFAYDGSLTTPGCHENVRWILFRDTLKIGRKQMEEFRKLRFDIVDSTGGAVRDLQKLNGRIVKQSFEENCKPVLNDESISSYKELGWREYDMNQNDISSFDELVF